ncbi:MAG: IPExxxVDY family protein [Cyclobacteriaceae bacterium]
MHTQLETDFQYDFLLFGISSSAKEYKLAWALNRGCICHFKKVSDITLSQKQHEKEEVPFAQFYYQRGSQIWRLIENRTYSPQFSGQRLIPELPNWNYLLWLRDPGEHVSLDTLKQNLKTIPDIKSFSQISVDLLANKDNLLF